MPKPPLDTIGENDLNLVDVIGRGRDLAFAPAALSAKRKQLTAVALDAAHGAGAEPAGSRVE